MSRGQEELAATGENAPNAQQPSEKTPMSVSYGSTSKDKLPEGSRGETSADVVAAPKVEELPEFDTTVHPAIPDNELYSENFSDQLPVDEVEAPGPDTDIFEDNASGESLDVSAPAQPEQLQQPQQTTQEKKPVDYSAPSVVVPAQSEEENKGEDVVDKTKDEVIDPSKLVQDVSPIREDVVSRDPQNASTERVPYIEGSGLDKDLQQTVDSVADVKLDMVRTDSEGATETFKVEQVSDNVFAKTVQMASASGEVRTEITTLTKNADNSVMQERMVGDKLQERQSVSYDEQGRVSSLSQVCFNEGSEDVVEKSFEYSDEGNLLSVFMVDVDEDANHESLLTYEYDDESRVVSSVLVETKDDGTTVETRCDYAYDNEGKLVSESQVKYEGEVLVLAADTTYVDEDGVEIARSVVTDNETNAWENVKYTHKDSDGRVVLVEYADVADGEETLFARDVYKYDDEGVLLCVISVDKSGDDVVWSQSKFGQTEEVSIEKNADEVVDGAYVVEIEDVVLNLSKSLV